MYKDLKISIFFFEIEKNFRKFKKNFRQTAPPLPPILADGVENFSFVMLLIQWNWDPFSA